MRGAIDEVPLVVRDVLEAVFPTVEAVEISDVRNPGPQAQGQRRHAVFVVEEQAALVSGKAPEQQLMLLEPVLHEQFEATLDA